jgi:hypothetical protein
MWTHWFSPQGHKAWVTRQRTSPWLPVPTVGAMGADAALDSWVILKKANKE